MLPHAELEIKERRLFHFTNGNGEEEFALTTIRANGASGPGLHIVWRRWRDGSESTPYVKMFSDNWRSFVELRDVFDLLAEFSAMKPGKRQPVVLPETIKSAILGLGFINVSAGHV